MVQVSKLVDLETGLVSRSIFSDEEIYQQDVAFDRTFGLGDTEFYCSKLIEKAFRAGGDIHRQTAALIFVL